MFTIRHATLDDVTPITQLEAACFPPAEAASAESFTARLTYFPDCFYVMEKDGRIISMVNGFITDEEDLTDAMYDTASAHNPNGNWQMVFGVATMPEEQGNGYVSILMRLMIANARLAGRKGLVLTCKEALLPFYARFDFCKEGISSSVHGGATWYQMRLTFPQEIPSC